MTYALRIFFIIWYNYKQITIPPPGFGLLDTSGKRHLGDTIFGGTDMRISRQNKILELIETYEIETQEELAEYLNKEGYNVTQATVSRDIRALKMTKVAGKDGKSRYAILQDTQPGLGDQYTRVLNDAVVSIEVGQNLVVIKTVTGMAMGVATALDALKWPEILGCIAGDDTIMCACKSSELAEGVMEKLGSILNRR